MTKYFLRKKTSLVRRYDFSLNLRATGSSHWRVAIAYKRVLRGMH